MTFETLRGESEIEKERALKTIQKMMNIPEEMSYQERLWICR